MVRFIHFAKNDNEQIYITEDIETDADDFVPHNWELISDTQYDIQLPSNFPLENQFEKIR